LPKKRNKETNMTTDKNKRACELLGICWHEYTYKANDFLYECSCGFKISVPCEDVILEHVKSSNPDFTTPAGRIQLLEIMSKREDWYVENWKEPQGFCWEIGTRDCGAGPLLIYARYLLDLPDKPNFNDRLLTAAIDFLEGK
jgi:hypothetical protein